MMEPIVDLMWTVEEDESVVEPSGVILINCGGGGDGGWPCCVACCEIHLPNFLTKWVCPS